jgi:hypothetical protein
LLGKFPQIAVLIALCGVECVGERPGVLRGEIAGVVLTEETDGSFDRR